MTDLWVASHLLLWIAVMAQTVIVVALMRQVGSLLIRVGATRSLDAGYGPEVGVEAPWIPNLATLADTKAAMIAFMGTKCGTCEALVPALNAVADSYSSTLTMVIVAEESPDEVSRWAHKRNLRPTAISAPEAFRAYGIEGTPYVFVLDAERRVASRGGVNHIEHLEELVRRCTLAPALESDAAEEPSQTLPLLPVRGG